MKCDDPTSPSTLKPQPSLTDFETESGLDGVESASECVAVRWLNTHGMDASGIKDPE